MLSEYLTSKATKPLRPWKGDDRRHAVVGHYLILLTPFGIFICSRNAQDLVAARAEG